MARDELQERAITEIGGATLRFTNDEVTADVGAVVDRINAAVLDGLRGWSELSNTRIATHGFRLSKAKRKQLLAEAVERDTCGAGATE